MRVKIEKLQNENRQDSKPWTEKVIETFKLCEVPDDEKWILYLKAIVSTELWDRLGNPVKKDVRGYYDEIMKLKYNETPFNELNREASRLGVGRFTDIREYHQKMKPFITR